MNASAAPIPFGGLAPTTTFFDPSTGILQWTSGPLTLPDGTTIGPSDSASNNIALSLSLTGDVTTTFASDISYSFGAGIFVDPAVNPGDEIFGYTYQLLENGFNVGSPFGFDELNPFAGAVNGVGTDEGGGPADMTFNGIDVTIYNKNQLETVQSFQVYIGIPGSPGRSIPDTSNTLALGRSTLTQRPLGHSWLA